MKLEVLLTHEEAETILAGACRANNLDVNTLTKTPDGYLMTYTDVKNGRLPTQWERLKSWFDAPPRLKST